MCRTIEATAADLQLWSNKKPEEEISAVDQAARPKQHQSKESRACGKCGLQHERAKCPAYGKICYKCKKTNHYARLCKSKEQAQLVEEETDEETDRDSVLHMEVKKVGKKLLAMVTFKVKGVTTELECQLDTAASCNVMAYQDYIKLGKPSMEKSKSLLTMYDGRDRKSLGSCRLEMVDKEGQVQTLRFEVLETKQKTLLSLDTCLSLNLISYERESVCVVDSQEYVTQEQLLKNYPDVFDGIGTLPGEYHIELDKSVPAVQNRPRKIPLAMKPAVEKKLQELEEKGVIAQVDEPTEWISNTTAVWKAEKGQVRICLDPRDLNKAIKRNHYRMPTLDDVLPQLKQAKVFSLLDAKDGFLQVKLSQESSYYTTFWGPKARYRWLRMPFGISSAPEEFQRRLEAALHGLEGVTTVADDVLVFGQGSNEEESRRNHDECLLKLMERAREKNLKFNSNKLRLHLKDLPYIGHRLTTEGVKPDPDKVTAFKEMPAPTTPQEVRRFLGMANYLSKFLPKLSQISEPLRKLTEKEAEFQWNREEREAFAKIKELMCSDTVLAYFDDSKPITIQCDASGEGLGATLLQEGRPVASVSRSLTKSERNYAAMELECLAVVFACKRFDQYVYGRRVTVETDHRVLEIISKRSLLAAPKQLQRMLLELQRYDLEVRYLPGAMQHIADTLSRAPVERPNLEELSKEEVFQMAEVDTVEEEIEQCTSRRCVHISDIKMEMIKREAKNDEEQEALRQLVSHGWPATIAEVPPAAQCYWNFQETITLEDGILYKGEQVIVPATARPAILQRLHTSHQGFNATLRRAKDAVYWPRMAEQIKKQVEGCKTCEEDAPAQVQETLLAHDVPKQPWAKVGMDLFKSRGKNYLVVVDYLTDYFEISYLPDTTAASVITAIKSDFARHGVPVVVQTDNGTQFTSREFRSFARGWEFKHTVSSPYNSRSNGKVESAVKIAKRLLKRSNDPYLALLEWRNTPTTGMGSSPVQRLFARRTRAAVPTGLKKLNPTTQAHTWEKKIYKQQKLQALRGGRNLPPLRVGEPVLIQDVLASKTQWSRGQCRGKLSDRSYLVEVDGRLLRRNRQLLRPSKNLPEEVEELENVQPPLKEQESPPVLDSAHRS